MPALTRLRQGFGGRELRQVNHASRFGIKKETDLTLALSVHGEGMRKSDTVRDGVSRYIGTTQ